MKSNRLLIAVLIVGGTIPLCGIAQPWSGIVDPGRAIDWSRAGVSGGIPARSTICATLNAGATVTQINSAINNCPSGQTVFLSAGIYNLGGTGIRMKSNVTLRGAGPEKTKLVSTRGEGWVIGAFGTWIQGTYNTTPQNLANWTGGYAKGSTVLTFSTVANLKAGDIVTLEQLNDSTDTDGVFVCAKGGVCSYTDGAGEARGTRHQRQQVVVQAIVGSQVTIRSPLHMPNWRGAQSPTARWSGGTTITGVGIENLSIDAPDDGAGGANIRLEFIRDSWIKGVRSVGGPRSHFNLYGAVNFTVRDSYLWGAGAGVSTSYGIETFAASSDLLIENNVVQRVTAPFVVNDGGSNIVLGYNFTIDNYRADAPSLMSASYHIHSPGTAHVLLEGNSGLAIVQDNWYGTVNFVTAFRNHMYGDIFGNPEKSSQTGIMQIAAYTRFANFVGNVLGKPGYSNVYEPAGQIGCDDTNIWCFGYSHANGGVTDSQTKPRAFRWGNYDTVTGAPRFLASEVPSALSQFANPVPASQMLPPSFYLSAKPWFFGSVAWPAVGPDVTGGNISGFAGHANKIPARLCWENSAVDPAYGSKNVRVFSPVSCYGTPIPSTQLQAPAGLRVL